MRLIAPISLVLMLTGCATAYQRQGFSGGFSELQLSENVWKVSFQGNGYTRAERSEELALLRCAELTLEKGYTHFGLADSKSGKDFSTMTTPTTSYTTGNAYVSGNNVYGSATTNTYGGQTFLITKPSNTNIIVMFKQKPENAGMTFDAKFICQSVGAKYEVVCGAPK